MIYDRFIENALKTALSDTPCVLMTGPRQAGKTTLVNQWASPNARISFDDWTYVNQAKDDPEGFIERLVNSNPDQLLVMDEVQHVPELFLPIKRKIDRQRRPGMFLLTGSANLLSWSQTPDSLAGRVEYIPLYPLSALEIKGRRNLWLAGLFESDVRDLQKAKTEEEDIERFVLKGGFPEAFKRETDTRRASWFDAYLKSLLEKDIYDISGIEQPRLLHNLLRHLAYRCGSTVNFADLAVKLQSSQITVKKYYNLLQMIYLICPLHAWNRNLGKRLVKSPKVYMIDSGLLTHLMSADATDPKVMGMLFEQFIFNELQKQISWSDGGLQLYYWRTTDGKEVDFVIENRKGQVVGLEVKSKVTLTPADWSAMRYLEQEVGDDFVRGIIIYRGESVIPLSDKIWAVPVGFLV